MKDHEHIWYTGLSDHTMGVFCHLSLPASIYGLPGTFINTYICGMYTSRVHDTNIANGDPDRVYFRSITSAITQGMKQSLALPE